MSEYRREGRSMSYSFSKSVEWKGEKTGIFEMRRHYANYFKGIPNFKEYRMKLVNLDKVEHIHEVLDEISACFNVSALIE